MNTKCLIIALFVSLQASAQTPRQFKSARAGNLFFELLGNAGLASLNYDQRFSKGTNGLGARIGVGVCAAGSSHLGFPEFTATVPFGLNYLVGAGPHHLELGAGVTLSGDNFSPVKERPDASKFFVPSIGYRFQSQKRATVFRAFFSPFIGSRGGPFGGISIGARL